LTAHRQIQDSDFITRVTDESRFSGPRRHHSVPYGRSPERGPARDVSYLSPAHRGAADVQQRSREWDPLVESPDPIYTPGPFRGGFVGPVPPSFSDIYDPSAPGGSPPYVCQFQLPMLPMQSQGVHTRDSFTSHLNRVGGEGNFLQNNGPSTQLPYLPHYEGPFVSTIERPEANHSQLSRNVSQGLPPIVSQNSVRCKVWTQ
jgi:hypothetical protein